MNGAPQLTLDSSYLWPDVDAVEIAALQPSVTAAHEMLESGAGQGADFLGWLDPATMVDDAQLAAITKLAKALRKQVDVMVVVGIGGSYLGARAVIEALGVPNGKEVWYAGQTLSADYTAQLLAALRGRKFCINVVSKSGTTTEPAVAFRLLRQLLVEQVGEAKSRELIIATTDPEVGALRAMINQQIIDNEPVFKHFPIPPSVGGRYSYFTAAGLLPTAFAGIDAPALREGAIACAAACRNPDLTKNPAYVYAAVRNLLYRKGKTIELLATFEPRLHYLAEWWKQLYGESEGKNGAGIFPASVEFTTDLHSMGQYIQEGRRDLFETFVTVEYGQPDVRIPEDATNADGLMFLAGKSVDEVNRRAYQGTSLAHRDGGVPNMTIALPALTPRVLGELLYFFEKACGVSGYLLGVNPFNQPGVEAYKKNMFALLGKPGFEQQTALVNQAIAGRAGKQIARFGK